jgi:hypothetical protein
MPTPPLEVDDLVTGAGTAGMAFTDALITDSDASVLMVDRRHAPGGHWNDAYPFVRLHQPSAFYGVTSTPLGHDRIDTAGPNAGFYERATAAEVCHYFQSVLEDRLLPSGQVEFLPMTSCEEIGPGQARVTSQLTGVAREVTVRRKIVDARYVSSSIPATDPPTFEVDDGVHCVPVNDLAHADHPAAGYVVIGAGKTAMDACTWLVDHDVDPDLIEWIKPRESWVLPRATFQPRQRVGTFLINWATALEVSATATTVAELFRRLEETGQLARVDTSVEPTMYRAAILSDRELDTLRTVERVIRHGRVRRIETDRIILDDAEVPSGPERLFVNCTADGLPVPPPRPIFEEGRITIQQLREVSPSFNAALIGYLEATRHDVAEQNRLTPPNTYPSTAEDWIRTRHRGLMSQAEWDATPDVRDWVERSRLNVASGVADHADEPGVAGAMGRYLTYYGAAIENLGMLRAGLGDQL